MNAQKTMPRRWIYGLAALPPALGWLIVVYALIRVVPGLTSDLASTINLNRLTRVRVPGSGDVTFARRGAYAVYYEAHSELDGAVYTGSETPPDLACTLKAKATGAEVGVVPDYVKSNTYASRDRARVGVLMSSIAIRDPGAYTLSCRYADGRAGPPVVLAVGPNFVWSFFGIVARPAGALAASLVVLLVSYLVAIGIVILVAVLRRRPARQS
jgi:hypothetical protein